jgi:hypothetical protein
MADRSELEDTAHHLSLKYPEALTVLADSMHMNTQFIFVAYVSDRLSLEMDTKRISIDGLVLSAALFQSMGRTARNVFSGGSRIYLVATILRLPLDPFRVHARFI